MDLQLLGKRALVTGSSIGIGESIAQALAREGAAVAVHGRDRQRAQRVATQIEAAGGKAVVVLGDLTQDEEVKHMIDEAERLLGGIDILVNNAGGSGEKQIWEKTAAIDWAAAYDRKCWLRFGSSIACSPRCGKWVGGG
jgi:3-oxoacyl-[acyl-carrier protein] reductase